MKSGSYKWFLLLLLSCAFFFHQADRALFGLLTIPIQNELHLTDVQIGWINTVLSWTLAGMALVAGPVGDRFSRKWIITLALIAWSLMTVCMGFVGGFAGTLFFRSIATGVGESFYAPSAYALIAVHHKDTRSVALSIHQAALYVGLMISGLVVAWALGFLGTWRNVFIAFGVSGCLLGVAFVWLLRDNANDSNDSRISRSSRTSSLSKGLKTYFCNPSALCATAGFVAIVFVNNAYLFWAPKFVAQKFATELGDSAVATAGNGTMLYHHVCAFAAIMAGGFLTDALVKRYPRFRLLFQSCALFLGAPALVFVAYAPSVSATWAAVALYGVFRGFFEVNTHASLFDVVAPKYRSTAVGLLNMLAFFFGGLSGILMGHLSRSQGVAGFELGFALMGGVYAVAGCLMLCSLLFTFKRNRVTE